MRIHYTMEWNRIHVMECLRLYLQILVLRICFEVSQVDFHFCLKKAL